MVPRKELYRATAKQRESNQVELIRRNFLSNRPIDYIDSTKTSFLNCYPAANIYIHTHINIAIYMHVCMYIYIYVSMYSSRRSSAGREIGMTQKPVSSRI